MQGNTDWLAEYDLDLTDEVTCEVQDCDEVAEWYMYHRCCHRVFLGCSGHCHAALRQLIGLAAKNTIVHCGWCDTTVPALKYMTRPMPLKLQP